MKLLRRLFNKKHENLIDVWHGNQWLKVKESKLKKYKVVSDREGKKYLIKLAHLISASNQVRYCLTILNLFCFFLLLVIPITQKSKC